jgi:hypothetical protein
MKNWLQQAIEENNKFNNSEYGKLSDNKLKQLDGAKTGGYITGQSSDAKKRMSKIGKEWAGIFGFNQMTKEEQRENGLKHGKQNLLKEFVCEKCGNIVNRGNYAKSHGKKCRELDKIKLINLLPNKFTKSIVKEIAKENNIKNWEQLNILHESCPYTKCIIKVDKPNQFNPCWYGKNKIKK